MTTPRHRAIWTVAATWIDATLGYRFITDQLEHGTSIGENRAHRLCRIAGIHASRHKKRSNPVGRPGAPTVRITSTR